MRHHLKKYLILGGSTAVLAVSLMAPSAFAKEPSKNGKPAPSTSAQTMQSRVKARLDKEVAAGTLTADQETAALGEAVSVEQTMKDIEKLPQAERKAAREKLKGDVETWAKQNGIDLQKVLGRHMESTLRIKAKS